MKNRLLSTIVISFCFVASYAQSQCDALLDAARGYKKQGAYEKAVEKYNRLEQKCPNYFTETVKQDRNLCKKMMESQNKPKQQKTSGGYVAVYQNESTNDISNKRLEFDAEGKSLNTYPNITVYYNGEWDTLYIGQKPDWINFSKQGNTLLVFCDSNDTPVDRIFEFQIFLGGGMDGVSDIIRVHQEPKGRTVRRKPNEQNNFSEETKEEQPVIVKISFESGKVTPKYDNIGKIIGSMEDNKNFTLQLEIPWCMNIYKEKLVKKRIKNITDDLFRFGISKERVSANMPVLGTENADPACDCASAKIVK